MTSPVLSICIPTYNRAKLLQQLLESLVALPVVANDNRIEIVVSDNASTDDTQRIASEFASRFPAKIKYFRNAQNVFDDNFRLALSRGTGDYLKLSNDTLHWSDEGLRELLAFVDAHSAEKPVLYPRNLKSDEPEIRCESLDAFLQLCGYNITWIAEFGIWRTDFNALTDFSRAKDTQLIQTDVTLRLLAAKRRAVIIKREFFSITPGKVSGGYNLCKVFGKHYLSLLKPYLLSGDVSRKTYETEKRKLLLHHIFVYSVLVRPDIAFEKTGYVRYLFPEYKFNWYFYLTLPFVFGSKLYATILHLLRT